MLIPKRKKHCFLFLIYFTYFFLFLCPKVISVESLLDKYFRIALDSYERKDYDTAEKQFNAILSINPEHAPSKEYLDKTTQALKLNIKDNLRKIETFLNKAEKALIKQKYSKAEKYFSKVLSIDPGNETARNGLKNIEISLIEIRKQKRKEQDWNKIEKLWRNALEYYEKGDYDNAKIIFKKILSIDPEHQASKEYMSKFDNSLKTIAAAHVNELYTHALELYIEGNYAEAIKYFETTTIAALKYFEAVVWTQPQRLDTIEFVQDCRQKLKEQEERIETMELAKIKQRVSEIYVRGQKYYDRGYFKAAFKELKQGKDISDKFKVGEYSKKINALLKLAGQELSQENYELGMTAFTKGNLEDAKKYFKKSLYYQPDKKESQRALERIE
ncbi:MAG: tetratricopeptide repeat protein [Endomicrobiales bacterium]|nr:tetratricopeptide repeat protein [Endomicrobiales bacterium]